MNVETEENQNTECAHNVKQSDGSHSHINQIIGIMSGKGGVGKSFVSSYLACSLVRQGYRVGVLDADFTGSSIAMLFGLHGPVSTGQYSFLPLVGRSGVKIISMNLLFANEDTPVIWKEQLVAKVVEELWREVEWGELDYLLVDLPPATSEVTVSILKTLPFAGLILVTTPQMLATKIMHKAVSTVKKIGTPIIGVVENMAFYIDLDSKKRQYVFGQCNGQSVANLAAAPILAQIPLDPMISKFCDAGNVEDIILDEEPEMMEIFFESVENKKQTESSIQTDDQESGPIIVGQYSHSQSSFSDVVLRLIQAKENMGALDKPDAQGYFLGSCGDRMQIDLRLSAGKIQEAKFLADGCGATIACGSMITKMACSKSLDEATLITQEELLTALNGLPEDHTHCAELAVMTLREAIIDAVEGHGKQ